MQQNYAISGMHCQGCARKIETALAPFGQTVSADFQSASLRVIEPSASLDELNQKLARIGDYRLSVAPETTAANQAAPEVKGLRRYYPLILIAGFLTVAAFANAETPLDWMRHFMAGFFLVFSFFKLLDIGAFADSYAMYDLAASRWKFYGRIYPFLELGLGFAYLFAIAPRPVLWVTLVVTIVSGIGVVRSMMRQQTIRCACLGAVLNVPVSTVTLIEDFGMAIMALAMLVG